MKRLWMPLYIGNYKADTAHLGALEHGAYLMLIMHYWQAESLPDDDKQLARIACTSPAEWRRIRPTIAAFFDGGWKHQKIERELAKSKKISESTTDRARQAANARWSKDAPSNAISNAPSTEQAMLGDAHQQLHPQLPRSIKKLGIDFGEEVKGRKTPPHGAVGRGRIWISAASKDWSLYADDYLAAHGEYPKPDSDRGGKWFRVAGEQARSA